MTQLPPTPPMARCLAAIERLTIDGVPPDIRSLQRDLGYANPGSVHGLLVLMRQRGLVDWVDDRVRTLRILPRELQIDHLSTDDLIALRNQADGLIRARAA